MTTKPENFLLDISKKRLISLLLFFLICLFFLIFIFRNKNVFDNFNKKKYQEMSSTVSPVLTIEQEASKASLLADMAQEATDSAKENVKVFPVAIVENVNPDTEERAAQFAILKSKCPVNEDTFSINFSYKNDKFDVLLVADKENEFWQWLAVNYPKLEKDWFVVAKL